MKKPDCMKGSAFLPLVNLIRGHGPDAEREWLSRLLPDERTIYLHGEAGHWYPLPTTVPNGITEAARVLFPDSADGLVRVGTLVAQESLRRVPLLIRTHSVIPFLRASPLIWKLYHSRGTIRIQDITRRSVCVILEGRPDFQPWFLDFLSGFFVGCIGSFGLNSVRVSREDRDPLARRWNLAWES